MSNFLRSNYPEERSVSSHMLPPSLISSNCKTCKVHGPPPHCFAFCRSDTDFLPGAVVSLSMEAAQCVGIFITHRERQNSHTASRALGHQLRGTLVLLSIELTFYVKNRSSWSFVLTLYQLKLDKMQCLSDARSRNLSRPKKKVQCYMQCLELSWLLLLPSQRRKHNL